ncbi:MAG: rhamnogalacturonan acetylesterase [Lachnospiraceae bacterium]|nr:rhamnogalacturonan acetylesterase [Lachnospiraceae bacterium]
MSRRNNYIIMAIATLVLSVAFLAAPMMKPVHATGEATYVFEGDGTVDGSKEFVIPAAAGENHDITIVFTGLSETAELVDITFDRVTEDQVVPNVQKGANDRSGLLGETAVAGVDETRTFSVAAIDGDIKVTVNGKCKVKSLTAVKQAPKTAGEKVTVYSLGDSLVQTYSARYAPQAGWGQTLSLFFNDNVIFDNRAIGGRSTGNFMRQGRLNAVLCDIKPGDYVLIEFGHNDATSSNKDRFVSPNDFRWNLIDVYIKGIRDRGATPILVTLCNRNQYIPGGDFSVSFGDYVKAMKKTAEEADALLIDLNAYTVEYFTQLGKTYGTGVTSDIIYNHGIPGAYEGDYAGGIVDNTHLQYYGAKVVSAYITEQLSKMNLPGLSENYVPIVVTEVPKVPTGIEEKVYEGHLSRIKWADDETADFYHVQVAEVVETTVEGVETPVYALAGEFTSAGYTTIEDFAYLEAEEGHRYAYKITAYNAAGQSEESKVFSFGLLTDEGESIIPEPETTEAETTTASGSQGSGFFDSPLDMLKIAFYAMLPFIIGTVCALIALAVKNRKEKK